MGLFDNVGKGTVDEAKVAVAETLERIDPLLTKVNMMARALVHGVISRFKVSIHIEVLPDPGPNPDPEKKEY